MPEYCNIIEDKVLNDLYSFKMILASVLSLDPSGGVYTPPRIPSSMLSTTQLQAWIISEYYL